jgi:large conductance mechanosensitive channel
VGVCCSNWKKFVQERGNVVTLAVAFVVGGAFQAVVTSFVNDILMPPLGSLLGDNNFQNLFVLIKQGGTANEVSDLRSSISLFCAPSYFSF